MKIIELSSEFTVLNNVCNKDHRRLFGDTVDWYTNFPPCTLKPEEFNIPEREPVNLASKSRRANTCFCAVYKLINDWSYYFTPKGQQ